MQPETSCYNPLPEGQRQAEQREGSQDDVQDHRPFLFETAFNLRRMAFLRNRTGSSAMVGRASRLSSGCGVRGTPSTLRSSAGSTATLGVSATEASARLTGETPVLHCPPLAARAGRPAARPPA